MILMIQSTNVSLASSTLAISKSKTRNLGEVQVAQQPDPDGYKPYEDEPNATEEWLLEYTKGKKLKWRSSESSRTVTMGYNS